MKELNASPNHVAGNDSSQVYAFRKPRYADGPAITTIVHQKNIIDPRGAMAIQFIERWAMIAAEMDGEDSSGRQKMRRMNPQEVTQHACDVVDALMGEFGKRGWVIPMPSYEELLEAIKDGENANESHVS